MIAKEIQKMMTTLVVSAQVDETNGETEVEKGPTAGNIIREVGLGLTPPPEQTKVLVRIITTRAKIKCNKAHVKVLSIRICSSNNQIIANSLA
jgi:hypothetical protein